MKNKTVKELAMRLNEIMQEKNKLDMEYDEIVKELWDRIPSLQTNPDIQPVGKGRSR